MFFRSDLRVARILAVVVLACALVLTARTSPDATALSSPVASKVPGAVSSDPSAVGRPNIVIVNTDDQRADSIKSMPKVRKWLARGGTKFTNAYVSIPSCCPSRATLMSGRYSHNNKQVTQSNHGLDMGLTLQRYLRDGGYFTGHSGKYLHWWKLDAVAPHWDRWTQFKGQPYFGQSLNFDGQMTTPEGYLTDVLFDRAIDYVSDFEAADDGKPFFLHITPKAPHLPSTPDTVYERAHVPAFDPPPSYLESDRSDKPPFLRHRKVSPKEVRRLRKDMTRTLYSVDDGVDRLMKHLEASGELADTLFVYTSDNGFLFGEHHLIRKFLPYRPSVEVPLLVRWPGRVQAGAKRSRFVTAVDIAPTVLKAAGVSQSHVKLDGKDIFGSHVRKTAFMEYYQDAANGTAVPWWASIRRRGFQYTEYYSNAARTKVAFREYYDMKRDPHQLRNLLRDGNKDNDPKTAALSRYLRSQMKCAGADCK